MCVREVICREGGTPSSAAGRRRLPARRPPSPTPRHNGKNAVSIMARMDDLSLASWECYFPIKIRGLVPHALYIINVTVEVGCLGGEQGASEGGGSNDNCGDVYFVPAF